MWELFFKRVTQIELPEMKNKISEMENTADEINRLDIAGDRKT